MSDEQNITEQENQEAQEQSSFEDEVNKIFDVPESDPFAVDTQDQEAGTEETSTDEGSTETPVDDSAKYWQSEADKRQAERDSVMKALGVDNVEDLSKTAEEMRMLMPIARYINENPNVLNDVENSLSSGDPSGQTLPQGDQKTSLKKPERPTKPGNYDPVDAVSDPDSASFKYKESLDSYRDDMLGYYEAESQKQSEFQAQQQALQQQQTQLHQLRGRLLDGHGLSDQEVDQFIQFMSSPESTSEENLVDYFRYRFDLKQKMEQAEDNQHKNKLDEMKREKERLSIKNPVGVVPGNDTQAEQSIEDQLMDRMIADHNRQNPW